MKVSIFSTIFATLLAASSAAPFDPSCQSQIDALRQIQIDALRLLDVSVTFYGAAGASFNQQFAADSKIYRISKFFPCSLHIGWKRTGNVNHWQFLFAANPLSISYIKVEGPAICTFYGINKGITHVIDGQVVPVGPPQTQVFGACNAL
jgi:hypothetical protein